MSQTPWDSRLWNILSTKPHQRESGAATQIINENLAQRRSYRLQPYEKSGSNENPDVPVPSSSEWVGHYQDMPCVANTEIEVKYKIIFKPDGGIEGSGSSAEGNFTIKGICNLRTGVIAWRQQSPSSPSCIEYGSKIAAEFYGKLRYFKGLNPAQVTGTFLTNKGRYCEVNLRCCETASEVASVAANARNTVPRSASIVTQSDDTIMPSPASSLPLAIAHYDPHCTPPVHPDSEATSVDANARSMTPKSTESLPTLLTGNMTPIKEGNLCFFPEDTKVTTEPAKVLRMNAAIEFLQDALDEGDSDDNA